MSHPILPQDQAQIIWTGQALMDSGISSSSATFISGGFSFSRFSTILFSSEVG